MLLTVTLLSASYFGSLGLILQLCAALRVLPTRTADPWTMLSGLLCLLSCSGAVLSAGGVL